MKILYLDEVHPLNASMDSELVSSGSECVMRQSQLRFA